MATSPSALPHIYNVSDARRLARRVLPRPISHYMDRGGRNERPLIRNSPAFEEWAPAQYNLGDVTSVDKGTDLLGYRSSLPLILSPNGKSQLLHIPGERSVARAPAEATVPNGLSTKATTPIETIVATGTMCNLSFLCSATGHYQAAQASRCPRVRYALPYRGNQCRRVIGNAAGAWSRHRASRWAAAFSNGRLHTKDRSPTMLLLR